MKKTFLILLVSFVGISTCIGQNSDINDIENEAFSFVDKELLDSGGVYAVSGIYFVLMKGVLLDSNDIHVLAIADYLLQHPTYIVELSYHRDCRGSNRSCRNLSQIRAIAVKERLVELGIEADRIIAKGYGETKPNTFNGVLLTCEYISSLGKKEAELMHQKNRRVEIIVLSKDFKVE